MKLVELVKKLDLRVMSAEDSLGNEVTGGYVSDLISDVLAHSRAGNLWITLQRHQNIVATASMKDLAGIVLVGGREPEPEALEKAGTERIPILVSPLTAFELVGALFELGIRGPDAENA
jgi:hypothetical protein